MVPASEYAKQKRRSSGEIPHRTPKNAPMLE
jgi:hypothetical protein